MGALLGLAVHSLPEEARPAMPRTKMRGAGNEHDESESETSESETLPLVVANGGGRDENDDDDAVHAFNRGRRTSSPLPPAAVGRNGAGTSASTVRTGPVSPSSSTLVTSEHRRRIAHGVSFETEAAAGGAAVAGTTTTAAFEQEVITTRSGGNRRLSPLSAAIRSTITGSRHLCRGTSLLFAFLGALLLGGMFVLVKEESDSIVHAGSQVPTPSSSSSSSFVPFDYDPVPLLYYTADGQPRAANDGTALSYELPEIQKRFGAAKEKLLAELDVQYGDTYVQDVFLQRNVTALRSPTSDREGWERMKRKLQIKLLAVQLRADPKGTDGASTDLMARKGIRMEPFVWATGGHSAAAGHGNLFNESYTAVLERTVQDAFATAGIRFRARNYAMGGTSSGPEVALCQSAIFGTDVDVLSWDYGMTDGRTHSLLEMYCSRAALQPNRPACVGIEVHGGGGNDRIEIMDHLETSGMTVLYLDETVKSAALRAVPDSDHIPEQRLDDFPPFVKNFKCDGAIERGHPYCEADKWTDVTGYCPEKPKFRTGWHPGWKWHALIGRLIGLSVLEMMEEALSLVEGLGTSDFQSKYDSLVAQEAADYEKFLQSGLSKQWTDVLDPQLEDDDLTLRSLFREWSVCHTAFLPAESRYRGIMTMNASQGGLIDYYKGIAREDIDEHPIRDDGSRIPRLVYERSDRQACDALEIDHKDYYYLTSAEGWKEWILPNQAERSVYAWDGKTLKGMVAFALKPCSWGKKCNPQDVREDGLELGQIEVEVNGVRVTQWTKVMGVRFLKHADGHVFPHNGTGQFEIRARVKSQGMYFRPTSFMFL